MYRGAVTTAARSAPDLDRAVTLFHALSDATRLSILEMLRGGERCVCDLQADLDAAQSRLSFHLRVLREAGLVSDRREGRWSYYSIVPDALAEVHDLAVDLQPSQGPHAGPGKGALPVLRAGSCCG
jgi:ArsR family transcriptional regulator